MDLPAEVFRAQLDELAASGRVLELDRALELLSAGRDDGRHGIVLTFDDAFGNFFEVAWPLLRERRLPAVLYVPVDFVDGAAAAPLAGAESLRAMSWQELREVAASGLVTIGSHSLSHPDLRRLPGPRCREELEGSRRRLEREIRLPVATFSYPRALWSPRVRELAAGIYDSAVAAGGRRNRWAAFDRYRLSRLPLRRDMPASLAPVLDKPIWLEEWAAAKLRRLVH